MNPQQPYYPPQPAPQPQPPANPYEFITDSSQTPKKPLLPTGNSMAQRLLIVLGGLFILVLVVVIFMNVVFGGSNNSTGFVSLAQQQNELVRVAGIGTQQAQSQDTKDFAKAAQLSILSAQQQTLTLLQEHGTKVKPKELALKQNAQTDAAINSAVAASSFDATFKPIMESELRSYAASLKQAFLKTSKPAERQMLSNDYDDAQLLLEQLSKADK